MRRNRQFAWFSVLVVIAFILRLVWVTYFPNLPYADSEWYFEQANNLAQNRGYIRDGQPTAMWPVGYPFFLSIVFRAVPSSIFTAKFANVILLTLDIGLLYYYARLICPIHPQALVLVAIVAFSPTYIMAASLISTEPLYACLVHLFLIVLLLAVRKNQISWWLLTAILVGIITYVRTEGAVLLLVAILFYVKVSVFPHNKQRRVRNLWVPVLMVLVSILIITPWTFRNWTQLGIFIPVSTTGCMNMWIGSNPDANGGFNWNRDPAINPAVLREDDTEVTWYQRSCDAAVAAMSADPIRMLTLGANKFTKLWRYDDSLIHWNFAGTGNSFTTDQVDRVRRITNGYYWIVLALSIIGVVSRSFRPPYRVGSQTCRRWSEGYVLTGVSVVFLSLVYVPFFGEPRFHFVSFPLLALFGAELIAELYLLARRRLQRESVNI